MSNFANTSKKFFYLKMQAKKNKALQAHLCMFMACAIWGLMSPVGKEAMSHGIDSITMVSFRVGGGCLLFWLLACIGSALGGNSAMAKGCREKVAPRDRIKLAAAAIFGLVFNQCCFTVGLSFTSPTNASIITTSMPIFAMVLSFLILKEPITLKKTAGVLIGCAGAILLILSSVTATDNRVGDIRGDILALCAQLSYSLYLTLFNPLIKKYSAVTVNKWMFLSASVIIWPFTLPHILQTDWSSIALATWMETAYVVVMGTFVGYILVVFAQTILRPTVVSIYNYVQPLVAVTVGVIMGISTVVWLQGVAVVLVFAGVMMVTKSKSRRDLNLEQEPESDT